MGQANTTMTGTQTGQPMGLRRTGLQQHDLSVPGREVVFIPAEVPHSVKNVGGGSGAELATYVVEKGKPIVALVK